MVNQVWEVLQGKKTYLVCVVGVVYALSALATGHMSQQDAIQAVLVALGGASMRHGISNS